jgi:TIR domain-containing protein
MADVFISYAKTDRPLALKLAAMLEAEGWKVWWDTSLTIGDDFRNEIMTELGRARAVIVIWTDASIKSDWVRSEAGRAQADRKLIPVKLAYLTYNDLPPPFDVLHTENVSQEDKIKAAVVAQLAKPAVEPSAWALLTKGFKYELLTWVGIVGGALTLFTNLGAVLKLADWARLLVQHWKEWTHAFWVWAFDWLGIHLEPEWTPILSFLLFGSLLTIGQAVKFKSITKNQTYVHTYRERSFRLKSRRFVVVFLVAILVMAASLIMIGLTAFTGTNWPHRFAIGWLIAPLLIIVLFARHRLHAASSVFLILVFFVIIAIYPLTDINNVKNGVFLLCAPLALIVALILLSVAPAKAVSRRLIFLALGLLLLIALNELSKLGLDVTAPKLQG